MSLIIKGMGMPDECSECLFSCYDVSVGAPEECIILGERSARYSRLKNCPLVEIPTPHGRLIDADDLDSITVVTYPNTGDPFVAGRLKKIIAPPIIEAEVE